MIPNQTLKLTSANGPIALANHQTSNEVFDGDCTMNMIIKKDRLVKNTHDIYA